MQVSFDTFHGPLPFQCGKTKTRLGCSFAFSLWLFTIFLTFVLRISSGMLKSPIPLYSNRFFPPPAEESA